jgi:adenosylcobinamide-GDP ribazoletransferase
LDIEAAHAATRPPLSGWRAILRDLLRLLRFHSRLPVPTPSFDAEPHAPPDLRTASALAPFAGLIIGLPGAAVLAFAASLGVPALMAAGLAVAASALVTGAMHEDGLADSFDGLGAGGAPERRLSIMRDSRLGTYGVTALVLALLLRATGLAGVLAASGPFGAALMLLAAASLSRSIMLMPMTLLPAARADGSASVVGRPTSAGFVWAMAWGCGIAGALTASAGLVGLQAAVGVGLALALAAAMTFWALRAIQGHTGDIAGACQQLAEIGFYLGMLVVLNGGRG